MERQIKAQQIENNFNSMMAALECIIDESSSINGLLVSGSGGVGKSYNVVKRLTEAHDNAECNFTSISGKVTTMGLYEALYNSRHSTDILLLDDVDVFGDETVLDLLKAVLDTSETRVVTYATTAKYLEQNGIPRSFKFYGKIVFITNKNLTVLSKMNNSLAPHCQALMTRCCYVDLQLFTNEEIMIHIENIMNKVNMLEKQGISKEGSDQILNWMLKNEDKLRGPSLRMPVLIGGLYNKFPFDWEEKCANMFLTK